MTGTGPLVLDLQAIQSPHHAERGIGRWALEFTLALCAARRDLVGAILLNPALPVPPAADALRATGKLAAGAGGAQIRGARIYHVLSPFELDERMESLWPAALREGPARLVATLYDLIPERYPSRYLAEPGHRRRYRTRCELVRAADAVLAISEATRRDGVERLGLHPGRVTSVGAGISPLFRPAASREAAWAGATAAVPRLAPGFVLSVGGEDDRKNLDGLLAGFAALPPEVRGHRQLVIACRLSEGYRAHLRSEAHALGLGPRLLLAGYVPDEALVALYQAADLFVLPSHYEGYGLPVAEALACGARVVASSTSAVGEVAPPAGQFDPADPASMAGAMARALGDAATIAALDAAAAAPPPTWAGCAARAATVYESLL